MREKRLTIRIKKSPHAIFDFTLNPANTPFWIDSIIHEELNEEPARLGSIFRNRNKDGKWSEYTVTAYKEDKQFEFTSKDGNYHVLYTFKPVTDDITEMEYYEWVDEGELEMPFKIDELNKLKRILENIPH